MIFECYICFSMRRPHSFRKQRRKFIAFFLVSHLAAMARVVVHVSCTASM